MATASVTKTKPINASGSTLTAATDQFNGLLAAEIALVQKNTNMNVLQYNTFAFVNAGTADVYMVTAIVQYTTAFIP